MNISFVTWNHKEELSEDKDKYFIRNLESQRILQN